MGKIILIVSAVVVAIAGAGLVACYLLSKQHSYFRSCGHTARGDENA